MAKELVEVGVKLLPNHHAAWGSATGKPEWPTRCSGCGAEHLGKGKYRCGAEYKSKPQNQSHTEVYWGMCPAS